jgi:hypothetical protein
MHLDVATLAVVLPMAGVFVGASLQYLFSRRMEIRKQLATLRGQAYVDFLKGCAQVGILSEAGPDRRRECLALVIDAKARIAVYGTPLVLGALAEYERHGANLSDHETQEAFIRLCQLMRREIIPSPHEAEADWMKMVLFNRSAKRSRELPPP